MVNQLLKAVSIPGWDEDNIWHFYYLIFLRMWIFCFVGFKCCVNYHINNSSLTFFSPSIFLSSQISSRDKFGLLGRMHMAHKFCVGLPAYYLQSFFFPPSRLIRKLQTIFWYSTYWLLFFNILLSCCYSCSNLWTVLEGVYNFSSEWIYCLQQSRGLIAVHMQWHWNSLFKCLISSIIRLIK